MKIKALKNISKDDVYFGLNSDDILNISFIIFFLRLFIVSVNHTYILLIVGGALISFTSYLRLNFRRKTIRDFIGFYINLIFYYKVQS